MKKRDKAYYRERSEIERKIAEEKLIELIQKHPVIGIYKKYFSKKKGKFNSYFSAMRQIAYYKIKDICGWDEVTYKMYGQILNIESCGVGAIIRLDEIQRHPDYNEIEKDFNLNVFKDLYPVSFRKYDVKVYGKNEVVRYKWEKI